MGEYADYILNGDDCQECGEYLGEGDGFPRSCASCNRSRKERANLPKADSSGRVNCPTCNRRVKAIGLKDHMRDAHTANPETKP